jgi:acyl-CoA synthetase (AMP-forming)/AMP-acid ligase II
MNSLFDFSRFAEQTALIEESGKEVSYNQLQTIADGIAKNIRPKSLVFCLCTNTVPSIAGYVSFIQNGFPVLLLDAKKNDDLLQRLLDIYSPNYIWRPTTSTQGKSLYAYDNYSLYAYSEENVPVHPDLSLLLTTSGSTGSPKLVRLTENNITSNAESIIEYLGITSGERAITSLPMYYSFGMSVINSHLHCGATLLLSDKTVMQGEFWKFVKEQKATSIAGVPYTYEMLRRLRFFRMDLPNLKTMIQAGGKLNADIVQEYAENARKAGKRFFVMYGQTEAGPRISYLPFNMAERNPSSIGIAIPGGSLSIHDSDGTLISEPGVDGELIYKGPNVCMGYAESKEDLAKGDENHGILHTGDIARFDKDGFFYITGRMKRFVKIWGNRCNLDSIEQLLKPICADCACTGDDEKIQVYVTDKRLSVTHIREYLSEKTHLNISAFFIYIIDKIPRTTSGKVLYNTLNH